MIMPFGKHKGLDLTDVPEKYLRWLDNKADLRDPLKSYVKHVLYGTKLPVKEKETVDVDAEIHRIISGK